MAVTLNIDELKNLTQLLEAAIAEEGEYRGSRELRLEICAQCNEAGFYGCECDNDD